MQAGDRHYKAFVGPPLKYDLLGALQFTVLSAAGMRASHKVCDIGCGSLRLGKLLIPFLEAGGYHGMEPERWLVEEGVAKELSSDLIEKKAARFSYRDDFALSTFQVAFDYLIAQSIFSHASAQQIERCLGEAKKVMRADSLFLATFVEGERSYEGPDWVYPGCVEYRPNDIADMAKRNGLQASRCNWPHPNGQTWYLLHFPEARQKVAQLKDFNLGAYRYLPPPKPAEPSLLEKVQYHLKRLLGKK